jgi:hypothetical protein
VTLLSACCMLVLLLFHMTRYAPPELSAGLQNPSPRSASSHAAAIVSGAAMAPAPTSPQASFLLTGSITVTPSCCRLARCCAVKGLSHMNVFMAGATCGAVQGSEGRAVGVSKGVGTLIKLKLLGQVSGGAQNAQVSCWCWLESKSITELLGDYTAYMSGAACLQHVPCSSCRVV